ncbi:MAG: glycosyltransferase family 4 protein [Desulfobacterales bacterium]|jgi:glycosyltransferase involved in cell wall biosynthesis
MKSLDKSDRLKLLLVSTSYPADEKDWRGTFTANLIKALSNNNTIDLRVWVPPGKLPSKTRNISTASEADWLDRLMKQGGIAHMLRTKGPFAVITIIRLLLSLRNMYHREHNNDVAHIHWLQNAIPLWSSSIPAVISVLGSDFKLLKLPGMTSLLRLVINQRACIITPNADWMAPALKKSFGDIAEIRPVPFGVDKKWFSIKRRPQKDETLKWLAVTRLTEKKLGPLFSWGKYLFEKNHELHLFGPMQETLSIPEWVDYRGPVSPNELMNKWFPLCSGLITLSQHDEGRPQVMLEAMAAGLPIIASDIPAHLDIVKHGINGWIVSDPQDLKNAISFFNTHEAVRRAGESARSWALKNIGTWDDCARRYITAYHDLLRRNR